LIFSASKFISLGTYELSLASRLHRPLIVRNSKQKVITMKAHTCEKYGPPEVLRLHEMDKPVPGEKDILIKVHATTVNAADCNTRGLTYIPPGLGVLAKLMLGWKKPKVGVLGSVLAGEVVEVGAKVASFKPGDRVYGTGPQMGAYAEYAIRPETGALAKIPENISFEEAAVVPYGALTALYFLLEAAGLRAGQKVLVNGASGGVGIYAVQLANYFGAEVTGVCSTRNLEFVRSLGANKVIDYTKADPAEMGETWDVILDVVVRKTSFKRFKKCLAPKGYYLAVAGGLKDMLAMIRTSITDGRKVKFGGGSSCEKKENLSFLNELIENGKLNPIVDKTFPFTDLVEAHRYTESGARRGSVAITVS
jgi:NADPH:quinone reductase-like Zn-dependent oxidoreductase